MSSDEPYPEKDADVLEDSGERNIPSDFAIKVGENLFKVHKKIVISRSEYFRAMLSHDTEENQQGFVDMKNVSVDGVRECVEFMYTGKVNITSENVEDILHTCDLIELGEVRKKCVKFLEENLDFSNCVSTLKMTIKYQCDELQKKAKEIYDKDFDMEMSKLLELSKEHFAQYLKEHSMTNEIAWDLKRKDFGSLSSEQILSLFLEMKSGVFASEKWWFNVVTMWIAENPSREEFLPKLLESIKFDSLENKFVDENVLNHPLVKNNIKCFRIIINALYTQIIDANPNPSFVLLYSDGRIRSYDVNLKSWEELPAAPKSVENTEIFYFNGKLSLINDSGMYYFNNNKWISKRSPGTVVFRGLKKLCVFSEFIYLICSGRMFRYDTTTEIWNGLSPPLNFDGLKSLVALDGSLYAFGGGNTYKFDFGHQKITT